MGNRISQKYLPRLSLIIAVFVLAVFALSCAPSNTTNPTPQEMDEAPDFTLTTLTGDEITLSELKGTPVVLNFWSTRCGFCVQELPYFEAAAQQNKLEMTIIAINTGESISRIQEFFGDYEPTMTVALDKNIEVFSNYSLSYDNPRGSIPFTFFIDSEGIIQHIKLGAFLSEAELQDSLRDLLETTSM